MEKYNPNDLRIHDPEFAHDLAHIRDHYEPYLEEARLGYLDAIFARDEPKIKELSETIYEYKEIITMYEYEALVAELNRRYYDK